MVIVFKLPQPLKADSSIDVIPFPILTEVKPPHPENADFPMIVTLSPVIISLMLLSPLNHVPMLSQYKDIDINPLQSWNLQLVVFQYILIKTVEK